MLWIETILESIPLLGDDVALLGTELNLPLSLTM